MSAFAEIETTLVNKGFSFAGEDVYSKTYQMPSNDGGWTEIILDKEYKEVVKDVYNVNSRQLSHLTAPVKSSALVARLLG